MAKCKLLMQTGQVQKIIDFFDGYSDDKVSCKYIKKVGIKLNLNVKLNYHLKKQQVIVKEYLKELQKVKYYTSQFNQTDSLDKIKMIRTDKSLFFSSQKITLCI